MTEAELERQADNTQKHQGSVDRALHQHCFVILNAVASARAAASIALGNRLDRGLTRLAYVLDS